MNPTPVIDLSHHNPTPDWDVLVTSGIIGVIHKATEGTSYKDPTLYDRARAAMDAGLLWSTYHFMRPGSMSDQMDWYLEVLDPVQGERLCLDHEDADVSLGQLEEAAGYLLKQRPDLQITVYSGHLIKEQCGPSGTSASPFLSNNTSLWIAQYTNASAPSWPTNVWPQWSLWQYTDRATIPGISQPVDGNRWNGDEASLKAWFGPVTEVTPAPTPPEPQPAIETVNLDMTTSPGVSVSFTLNKQLILAHKLSGEPDV